MMAGYSSRTIPIMQLQKSSMTKRKTNLALKKVIQILKKYGYSLDNIVDAADHLECVYKKDLQFGDIAIIKTTNSEYTVQILTHGYCLVSGGWFDRRELSPMKTLIRGCNWGGSIIKIDIIAARGLCLEFGNRVVTSPVQSISFLSYGSRN